MLIIAFCMFIFGIMKFQRYKFVQQQFKNLSIQYDKDISSLQQDNSQLQEELEHTQKIVSFKDILLSKVQRTLLTEMQKSEERRERRDGLIQQKEEELKHKQQIVSFKDNFISKIKKTLFREIEKSKNEIERRDSLIQQKEEDISSLQQDNSQLQEELEHTQKIVSFKDILLSKVQRTLLAEMQKSEERSEERRNGLGLIQQKEEDISSLQQDNSQLQEDNSQLQEENNKLVVDNSQTHENLKVSNEKIEFYKNDTEVLQKENKSLKSNLEQIQTELDTANSTIQINTSEKEELQKELSTEKQKVQELEKNNTSEKSKTRTRR